MFAGLGGNVFEVELTSLATIAFEFAAASACVSGAIIPISVKVFLDSACWVERVSYESSRDHKVLQELKYKLF